MTLPPPLAPVLPPTAIAPQATLATPPPTAPPIRLPPPAASAAPAATALLSPDQVQALQRRLADGDADRARAAQQRRRKRRVRRTVSVAVVIGIAAAAFLVGRNLVDLATDASESPGVVSNEFVVELDDVRFAFPYEPVTESAPFEVEGTHAVASTWYIENDDLFLDAIHIEFAGAAMAALEQDPATQIGPVFGGTLVDVVIGGFARQVGGSIARSEAIDVEGAIVSQRGEIDTDDGTIFIEVYYLGTTLLAVMGSDYTDSTPETYLDLVASVELQS